MYIIKNKEDKDRTLIGFSGLNEERSKEDIFYL